MGPVASLMLLLYLQSCFALFTNASREEIMKQTLPAYSMALKAHLLNSSKCREELDIFRDAVDHRILWSLKVLDSSGEAKPGFIYGNNYWFGSRSECEDSGNREPFVLASDQQANNSKYREAKVEFPPFQVNYFVVHLRHNSTLQYHVRMPNEDLVTLGLCLPASCNVSELSVILEKIIGERSLLINDLYSVDFQLFQVRDLRDDHQWLTSTRVIVIGLFLILMSTLIVIGTIYDIVVYQRYLRKTDKFLRCENNNTSLETGANGNCEVSDHVAVGLKPNSHLVNIILCFSIYSNTKIIFNTKLEGKTISSIHGLRFLSMMWVILVHTIYYTLDHIDNVAYGWRMSDRFFIQVISNATFCVDTFFFLSGFLVAYLYWKHKERKQTSSSKKVKVFFLGIVNRFMRITPAYMTLIGIVELNTQWYGKTSQFYMTERPHEICSKYWWRNILYIQNLFSRDTMCLSWSWYLANDMQFFIIATFLLLLSSTYFRTSMALLSSLLVVSTVLTGYISYSHRYVPTLDAQHNFLDILYDPPWTRIGPYIIGIFTAYIITISNQKLNLSRRSVLLCWCLGSSCNLFVLFGLWEKRISVLSAAFYVALSRTIWAIGLAWILVACYTKHAGIVDRFLSFKSWNPLSKLTYCAYLLNPLLIKSIHLNSESTRHIEIMPIAISFLGNVTTTYLCAYLFSVMFEAPFILLLRQYSGKR